MKCGFVFVGFGVVLTSSATGLAGPPYVTDDPEPVEHRHWELYLASLANREVDGWAGTSPHVEVNYGVVPDVQLHLLVSLAFALPRGGRARFGLGDTELGVKWRFIHETDMVPQVGTFPFLEIPTGSAPRELGNGAAQVFLPLWLQKSFGRWTTYGGGGLWLNTASGDTQPWVYVGWQIQRQVVEQLALGAEVFCETPKTSNGDVDARFNIGLELDLSSHHHILASAGRGFIGPDLFQAYAAWLVTLGPGSD